MTEAPRSCGFTNPSGAVTYTQNSEEEMLLQGIAQKLEIAIY
jgi:hypothetical protein